VSEEQDLGLRLLIAIRKKGKTQSEVAKAVGITPKHMSQLVNGGSRIRQAKGELLIGLSQELDVTLEYLLGIEEGVEEKDFVGAVAQLVGV
jgi:transcriptional regulator with XRE-family HTH domain